MRIQTRSIQRLVFFVFFLLPASSGADGGVPDGGTGAVRCGVLGGVIGGVRGGTPDSPLAKRRPSLGPACGLLDPLPTPTFTDAEEKAAAARVESAAEELSRAEALHAQANLYLHATLFHLRRARAAAERFDAAGSHRDSEGAARERETERRETKQAADRVMAAIKQYVTISRDPKYAAYGQMDEVLYQLVWSLTLAQREDLARPIFKRLLTDFPRSSGVAQGYFAFGEYFLDAHKEDDALKFFEKALPGAIPDLPLALCTLYFNGWVQVNRRDYQSALTAFTTVARTPIDPSSPPSAQRIVHEARMDIARVLAFMELRDVAIGYFRQIGGNDFAAMVDLYDRLSPRN